LSVSLWAKGLNAKDTHKEMFHVYGGKSLSRKAVHNWVEKFSQGCSKVAADARPIRPVKTATEVTVQRVEELIRADKRITTDSVATALGCSHSLACSIMHDRLKFREVCARRMPRELKDREKMKNRMALSLQHLLILQYADEGDCYWGRIMGESLSSRIKACFNAMETTNFTFNQMYKVTPSAGKVLLTVFWVPQAVLLAHFLKRGENVNSASYCKVLLKLRVAIHRKHPSQLARGVLLHHDNARPHTAGATQERIQELQWELREHPPYSLGLAPSDFHLFGPLKNALVANVSLMTKRLKWRCGSG
jgi:histone-lysine N-methyltransferase SETMAR